MSAWQRWLEHPEHVWVRNAFLQVHLWVGVGAGLYITLMSVSGSILVYSNRPSARFPVEWLADLHGNLVSGSTGRLVNGVGAICVTLLCLTGAVIWWPGIQHWRRSLTVDWKAHFGRVNWDLHSSLGFWCLLLVLMWAISGIYLCFPQPFSALVDLLEPGVPSGKLRFGDQVLFWLSNLHFGRFGWFSQTVWTVFGLVPAVLSFTGVFLYCHRMIYKRISNPNT